MANKEFALPQSSWIEQKKMIEAYFHADDKASGEAVTLPDVAQRAAIDQTQISRNNKFFESFGIIQGGQKKRVTEEGKALGLSISHRDTEGIQRVLGRLVLESEFLSRILSAVKVRSGMDSESLERHIAITAGVPKGTKATTGARSLIEMMVESGTLVRDEGGTLRIGSSGGTSAKPAPAVSEGGSAETYELSLGSRVKLESTEDPTVGLSPRVVTVNVTINVDSGDFPEIESFLRELTGLPQEKTESSPDSNQD